MLGPLVTHPLPVSRAQIQPYLGVEHRIESIHIHVFTYQLQEQIREGLSVGPLGLPGQGLGGGQWRTKRGQPRLKKAHCHSEWGTENWSPCLQKVLCSKECPKHTASTWASWEHVSGRTLETGHSRQARIWG